MVYKNIKSDEEVETQEATPIRIIPMTEDFRENLYRLYERYNPEYQELDI